MSTKLYGNTGRIGKTLYAVVDSITPNGSPSSEYDPVINEDKEWQFHESNRKNSNTYPFIQRRQAYTTAYLNEGQLNFTEGEDLMPFREYYMDQNSAHNLIISSRFEFDRLAQSPTIKVKDGSWTVLTAVRGNGYSYLTDTKHFYLIDGSTLCLKTENGNYDVYFCEREEYVFKNVSQIIPKKVDYANYLLVKQTMNNESLKWNVYDKGGRRLIQESFDSLDVIAPNGFRYFENNTKQIIDSTGNYIFVQSMTP